MLLYASTNDDFVSLQMLEWIQDNRDEFLCHFTEIGEDLEYATELREEHKQFEENCGVRLLI